MFVGIASKSSFLQACLILSLLQTLLFQDLNVRNILSRAENNLSIAVVNEIALLCHCGSVNGKKKKEQKANLIMTAVRLQESYLHFIAGHFSCQYVIPETKEC